jgi:hypothetical protein
MSPERLQHKVLAAGTAWSRNPGESATATHSASSSATICFDDWRQNIR